MNIFHKSYMGICTFVKYKTRIDSYLIDWGAIYIVE